MRLRGGLCAVKRGLTCTLLRNALFWSGVAFYDFDPGSRTIPGGDTANAPGFRRLTRLQSARP